MKIGLVGLAGSGKTTVFNTMTGMDVPVGFGGELKLGVVRVPDQRIDELSGIFSPRKTTYAEMSFCDIPDEHGAEKKGLSPRGLQQIRDQEALCLVLRDFVNPAIEGDPDPAADLEASHTECVFADLEIGERRLERAKKERAEPLEVAAFELMKATLEDIASHFQTPVMRRSNWRAPTRIAMTPDELMDAYRDDKENIQEGYKYRTIDRLDVYKLASTVYYADADYTRFNDQDEIIFQGRSLYYFTNESGSWKMFAMGPVERD